MIQSFGDAETQALFYGTSSRRWANIQRTAMRKLAMLNRAQKLSDLRIPASNHLKALKGDLAGYHSIRINDQFRVVFIWRDNEPCHVSIVDYH
jgi:toxin HigB-1